MTASFVCIHEDHPKRRFDGKMKHEFGICLATWVGECTAGAGIAHFLDVRVHFRPEISKAETMKGAIGIEVSIDWIGVECNEDYIEQCFWNNLQPSVWSTATDGFPIYKHVIFNRNMRLLKGLTRAVVHVLQGVLANLAGIMDKVMEGVTLRIIGISLNPTTVRWKSWPNCIIDECLNSGSWCSKLLGQEDFTVRVLEEGEVGMNLPEYPARSASGERAIQAKFVFRMRETVSRIISESKASSEREWWDALNVGMILVSKLNPEEVLEHVCIRAGVKRWAEAGSWNDCRAR
jgi:hypothetical protein